MQPQYLFEQYASAALRQWTEYGRIILNLGSENLFGARIWWCCDGSRARYESSRVHRLFVLKMVRDPIIFALAVRSEYFIFMWALLFCKASCLDAKAAVCSSAVSVGWASGCCAASWQVCFAANLLDRRSKTKSLFAWSTAEEDVKFFGPDDREMGKLSPMRLASACSDQTSWRILGRCGEGEGRMVSSAGGAICAAVEQRSAVASLSKSGSIVVSWRICPTLLKDDAFWWPLWEGLTLCSTSPGILAEPEHSPSFSQKCTGGLGTTLDTLDTCGGFHSMRLIMPSSQRVLCTKLDAREGNKISNLSRLRCCKANNNSKGEVRLMLEYNRCRL